MAPLADTPHTVMRQSLFGAIDLAEPSDDGSDAAAVICTRAADEVPLTSTS